MIRLGKNIGFAILISVLAIGGCWHFFNFQNDSLVEADSLQGCASGEACPSGTACNNTVCCPSGYCGWGDNVYFVRECVASGQIRENSWASLICRSGIWKVRLNGWGCNNSAWGGCDEGWCQTFGDAGFCRSCAFDSGLAQGCANGEACPSGTLCNNTVCCPSGTCGYGDGLVFGRQCVASGEIRENLWGRQICRNGVWKTLVGGWGCDLFGECESGSCQKIGGYHYCISSLPFSSAYTSTAYNTGMYCQGTCRTCASEGNVCGNMSDNCGGTIYCGDCSSGQTCASGQCVSSCVNDCSSSGAKQCGGNGVQTCGNYDADSCLEWSAAVACSSGQICASGQCVSSCVNDCSSSGAKQCGGNGVQTCGNYDADSCLEWSAAVACSSGQICASGVCVASSDDCTAEYSKKCYNGNVYWYDSCGVRGDVYQNCGNSGSTSNYQCGGNWLQQETVVRDCAAGACTQDSSWNNVQDCALSGKICKNGVCIAACVNDCSSSGAKQCGGNGVQTCGNYDADSCLEWSAAVACSSGQICASGVCGVKDALAPVISGLAPSGKAYNSSVVLVATTNEAADCRYSWYDRSFDQMTLPFKTSNKLYHSAPVSLSSYGKYTYYVRCKDAFGNANQIPSKISFDYVSATGAATIAAPNIQASSTVSSTAGLADKTPAAISGLAPSGAITNATTVISCVTGEKATCRYDIADTDYDSMENTMDTAAGVHQSKTITLSSPGNYNYYVRCKDAAGNKNADSVKINFDYAPASKVPPVVSELQPASPVYQKSVMLTAVTDKAAQCRWSTRDQDFDAMPGQFSATDGQNQQAIVDLNDYGRYDYYVRCKDDAGGKAAVSSVISFEYKNPELEAAVLNEVAIPAQQEPVACGKPVAGASDGACSAAVDCVCDPDCSAGGGDDPDCAAAADNSSAAGNLLIIAIPVVLIVVVVALIAAVKKRRGGEDGGEEN
ncbi:MAG: hypothetical protein L7H18_01115 [Candidatus Nealsonbacteria bacterium DGGOD1a]|nr:MAG: hypothetical protein L7H18_01115 [Candidatus Nealsonbacteria bacterium DGGOD1a]